MVSLSSGSTDILGTRDRERDKDGRHRSRGRGDRERDREYYDEEEIDDYDRPPRSSSRRHRDRDRSSSRQRERGDRDRDRERDRDRDSRKVAAERIYEDQEFDHEEEAAPRTGSRPLSASATGGRAAPNEPPPRSLREAAANNVRAQSAGGNRGREDQFTRSGEFDRVPSHDAAIELDHVV